MKREEDVLARLDAARKKRNAKVKRQPRAGAVAVRGAGTMNEAQRRGFGRVKVFPR